MTDWTRDAAEEIAVRVYESRMVSGAWIASIIEKHCPFKRHTAYIEVSAIQDDTLPIATLKVDK